MPTTPKRKKERQIDIAKLTEAQEDVLLKGSTFNFYGPQFNGDVELLREAWQRHGWRLLPKFIQQHAGCRPFCWWKFEHGKERPILNHTEHDESWLQGERAKTFGFCHTWIGIPKDGDLIPWLEEQHVYLRRHNLLTPAELAMTEDELTNEAM